MNAKDVVLRAREKGIVIPAINVPYLPVMKAIVNAAADENSVVMIEVARVEWEKFGAISPEAIAEEYGKCGDSAHTLLHLDHIPVIDEDNKRVDYAALIKRAIAAGFQSVMVDGSRLPLEENINAAAEVAGLAHEAGIPCEAELGAVMGHESGPIPPYEEIFASKKGFTSVSEAERFVKESGVDWLSIAAGNIHGAVAEATRHQKKPEARLDIEHIEALYKTTNVPLVLHGGSGINIDYIRRAIAAGIAKINIGTEVRQAYEAALAEREGDIEFARQCVYEMVRKTLSESLRLTNSKELLNV